MIFCGARTRVLLIGTFFILQRQCSVDAQLKIISHQLVTSDRLILPPEDTPEACQKDVKGEAMLIEGIIFRANHLCSRDIYRGSSSVDTFLKQTVARECNGKNRCILSDSVKRAIQVNCEDHPQRANEIVIYYVCKPIKPDNQEVFSIKPEMSTYVTSRKFNTTYLVLDLQQTRPTEMYCEIKGNNQELKFTLLHVDFGPNLNCNRSDSTCHGHINITDDKRKTINYTYNWLPGEIFNGYFKFVTFDISMSTGLVWIELSAYVEIHVECRDNKESRNTPHIPETNAEYNGTKGISNTTRIPVTSSADGCGSGFLVYIVVSLSVALLVSLIATGALVVCRFSRKRRMAIYDIPVVTYQDLHPYNNPIVDTQHGTGREYLETVHCDDGYEEPTVAFQHDRLAM